MNKQKLNLYWTNYLLIEKEFRESLIYVSLDEINYNTFSSSYLKLMLQLGSEIDNVFQLLSILNNQNDNDKIKKYYDMVNLHISTLFNQEVKVFNNEISLLKPFENWNENEAPEWWRSYQEIKHNRTEIKNGIANYKKANLKNILNCLSALFLLLMYTLKKINDDDMKKETYEVFDRLSKLFYIDDGNWKKEQFTNNIKVRMEGETLYLDSVFPEGV